MAESKLSFDGVRVANIGEAQAAGLGAFCFSARDEQLTAMLPDYEGEAQPCSFNISNPNTRPYWQWDGNKDKPTLTPSLHWVGQWHGFLRAGRFESV